MAALRFVTNSMVQRLETGPRAKKAKPCGRCGEPMGWGNAGRKYCGPCYEIRSQELLAKRRALYRKVKP